MSDKTSKKPSYVFVISLVDYEGHLPYQIIENHHFDRASSKQINEMKEINKLFLSPMHQNIPYEYNIIETIEGTGKSQSYEKLPEDKWRYWVINFMGYNTEIQRLEIAFELLPHEVRLGYTVLSSELGAAISYNAPRINCYFMETPIKRNQVAKLNEKDLNLIGKYYLKIKETYDKQNSIWISLLRYHLLRTLPEDSEIRIIGLFSVIEALITHRPKLVESLDSITHQIYSKIILLHKRSSDDLMYSYYFVDVNPKKVWTLLYEYRSRIVHGDWVYFKKTLSTLKNISNVYQFLDKAVKMLLKQAILEQELILDLKMC